MEVQMLLTASAESNLGRGAIKTSNWFFWGVTALLHHIPFTLTACQRVHQCISTKYSSFNVWYLDQACFQLVLMVRLRDVM